MNSVFEQVDDKDKCLKCFYFVQNVASKRATSLGGDFFWDNIIADYESESLNSSGLNGVKTRYVGW